MPVFRAFRPEPVLFLENRSPEPLRVVLENVHPEARLLVTPGGRTSTWQGELPLERILEMAGAEPGPARTARAKVFFPQRTAYTFAAIGDTGGATELKHCLDAARDLGADFLIHLGDFAYAEGQLENAAELLREAGIPVFAAIGNHDFHGGHRSRFLLFRDSIGPLDSFFSFRGVEFLNLDTAADLVPAGAGQRGTLLRQVESLREPMQARGVLPPLVVFTHRPLVDPRTIYKRREKGHALNRTAEADWLRGRLLDLGTSAYLAGHVHESWEFDDQGLPTFISGDGLMRRGKPPKILIGEWVPGSALQFRWEALPPLSEEELAAIEKAGYSEAEED